MYISCMTVYRSTMIGVGTEIMSAFLCGLIVRDKKQRNSEGTGRQSDNGEKKEGKAKKKKQSE